jgi:hypothetical protein
MLPSKDEVRYHLEVVYAHQVLVKIFLRWYLNPFAIFRSAYKREKIERKGAKGPPGRGLTLSADQPSCFVDCSILSSS